MLREALCVISALSVLLAYLSAGNAAMPKDGKLARQGASKCDTPTEAQQISKFSDKVSRQGDELILRLKDGTVVSRRSSPGDWPGYYDCEGNANVAYTFHDFIDPWYVIRVSEYEGNGTQLINRDTGEVVELGGYAILSPDNARFLVVGFAAEDPSDREIWRLSQTKIIKEWALDDNAGYHFRWTGPSTVEVSKDDKVVARLKHDGTSWKCSGASDICYATQIAGSSQRSAESPPGNGRSRTQVEHEAGTGETRSAARFPRRQRYVSPTDPQALALISAASRGDAEAAARLVAEGADVNAMDDQGWTALERASDAGHVKVVELLLGKGARVNGTNPYGCSLVLAASRGHLGVVELLVGTGPDVNTQGANGSTPLMVAAWNGHSEVVKYLLAKGADANVKNEDCYTPLNGYSPVTPDVGKLLLDTGAEVDARNREGQTALMKAAWQGHSELVKLLLERRADVNAQDAHGVTPLMEASGRGYLDVVKLLLEKGAERNIKTRNGVTAVNWAADWSKPEVAKTILMMAGEVNARDDTGVTPLMEAAGRGYLGVVKALLEKGADVNVKDKYGWNALTWAAQGGHMEEVRLLQERGAEVTLTAAACLADMQAIQNLIKDGADVSAQGANGRSPLMCAAALNHSEVVKLLLAKGANVNARDEKGMTALMEAANRGYVHVARMLADRGAEINAKNSEGRTPLMGAAERDHYEVVKLLLEKGADINAKEGYCQTALDLASENRHAKIAELLKTHGGKESGQSK
ncbi:MAG: ankyrin repeat domain-containing protein [Thermodesulfobacteriota bacterium]